MNFYQDVIVKDSRFNSMSVIKDPLLLEPITRSAVANVICTAETMYRLDLRIGETYRSVARQHELYLRGATTLPTVGVHHYGLACDLWIYIAGIPSWKADYSALRALSIIAKMVWGGDWGAPDKAHTVRDFDHIQRISLADQTRLFAGSWYPATDYVAAQLG
jgi:hypothetical protein